MRSNVIVVDFRRQRGEGSIEVFACIIAGILLATLVTTWVSRFFAWMFL